MAVEIDSLEINISTNSGEAAKGINSLVRSIKKLVQITSGDLGLKSLASDLENVRNSLDGIATATKNGAAKGIGKIAKELSKGAQGAGKAAEEINDALSDTAVEGGKRSGLLAFFNGGFFKNIGKSIKDIGAKVKKSVAPISKLLKSVGRVAFYRLIRSALKAVTQAAKEGVQNAYQFSKAMGGDFAKTMDEAATNILYVKNALGTALVPIIQTLLPVVVRLADGFANLSSKVAEAFSAFNGKNTFLKVKKSATEYAEAVNEATKATLGFDELNILSAKQGNSIADMFEEAKISENAARIGSSLKKNLAIIGAVTGTVALALGTLLLFTGVSPGIGLGLIALGAVGLGVASKQISNDAVPNKVKEIAAAVMAVGGEVSVVVGILAMATGHIGLGLGFIALGIGSVAGVKAVTSGDGVSREVKSIANRVMAIGGAVSLVLGILVCATGNLPVGLGLIALGAANIGTVIATNWNEITSFIDEFCQRLWDRVKAFFTEKVPNFFKNLFNDVMRSIDPKNVLGLWSNEENGGGGGRGGRGAGESQVPEVIGWDVFGRRRGVSDRVDSTLPQYGNTTTSDLAEAIGQAVANALLTNAQGEQQLVVNVNLDGRQLNSEIQRVRRENGVQIGTGGLVFSV